MFLFWQWFSYLGQERFLWQQRLGGFHAGTNGMELKLEGGFPQELVFLHHTQQIHGARAAQVQVSGGEVKPHCVRDLAEEFQMLVPLPHEAIALSPSGLEAEAPQGQHRLFCAGTVRGVGFEHRKDGGQVSLGDIQS